LKLKITNSKLYDMFILVAKANGNNIETEKTDSNLPKASFNGIESFLAGGL